jgi:TolB protein
MMNARLVLAIAATATATLLAAGAVQPPPASQPPRSQQPREVFVPIVGDIGAKPRIAVAPFVALTPDKDTQAVAQTITAVLFDDLDFEKEYAMIPADVVRTVPAPRSIDDATFDRWREIGADGVVVGTVEKTDRGLRVQVRMLSVRTKESAFGKEYSGTAANPRLYAHTISDDIYMQQRRLRGVARTKLAFSSDRDGERVRGPIADRSVKEIYISDYDGANQRRVTVTLGLNDFPVWSADGRSLAYTSWRQGYMTIFVSHIYETGPPTTPAGGGWKTQNYLAAWSPDGSKIAFTSSRDGNAELYIMNADGSGVRRLTNNPAADVTPTWSPTGAQLAFVSDRTGSPQIYLINADGTGLRRITFEPYCDRPTWSPAPFNEIAYSSRTGPGHDIKIYEIATGQVRQLTFGEGTNESPAFAPNGRHLAFTTTRWGKVQIAVVGRDGNDVRQLTRVGNNYAPNWSQ